MSRDTPHPEPAPVTPNPIMRRCWRILRLLALLSVAIAAIAVVLVARGDPTLHVHMLIATALGTSFIVLIGSGLMTLMFLSASGGYDGQPVIHVQPPQPHADEDQE